MDYKALAALIAAVAGLSGIILGWLGRSRSVKKDVQEDAKTDARLQLVVDYIKNGVDEVRLEQRAARDDFKQLSERVIRLEESAKSAHHRIDRLEKE